ncbi:MFS transporter [Arthrobacter sp. zg-Y859]|uniref:MFS transporter n=1 Tax=Arthrobacter jinronghuae TaxID=2964609 RepID=A0ABT1NQI4_9MICC|nr:MFS transporter [Arthrobacter jinronghuae]MCQ1950000.1 MFS transporter [Arthrobacter jinronghuae]UWX80143.1 MFS transporter [Arthrobacter jinronghuae]
MNSSSAAPQDAAPPHLHPPRTRSPWWGVASLSVVLFAIVTSEFLPASLLSRMSSDLGISEGLAGQAVTATAVAAAVTGPAIALVLPRLDRRIALIGLVVLAAVSNLLVALAPSFAVLLSARLLLGVAVGGFWALAIVVVATLVSRERIGRGMMVVNVGVSLATIVAVPLGLVLGELWGWRALFLLAAAASVVGLVLAAAWLPPVAPEPSPGRAFLLTLRSPLVIVGMVGMFLIAGGHFAGYTYIRLAGDLVAGLNAEGFALALAAFGFASFVGNLASGPAADGALHRSVVVMGAAVGIATIMWATLGSSLPVAVAAIVLWGLGFGAIPTLIQSWMARAHPESLESVSGVTVAAFQLAIGLGSAVGGVLVNSFDVRAALVAGGAAALLGGVLLGVVRTRRPGA